MARTKTPYILAGIIASLIYFGFTAVNVNQILGVIYLSAFTLGMGIIYNWDKKRDIPFDRTGNWVLAIFQAIGVYVLFVFLAIIASPIFMKMPVDQLIALISTTTPALAQSKILNTITFVFFVPFVETMFFVMLFDLGGDWFGYNPRKINLKTIFVVLLLSFLFMIYHVTAKGISNNLALMMVFLMMFISLIAASFFGEAKQVVFFHMIANAFGLGLLSTLTGTTGITGGQSALFLIPFFLIKSKEKKWYIHEKEHHYP